MGTGNSFSEGAAGSENNSVIVYLQFRISLPTGGGISDDNLAALQAASSKQQQNRDNGDLVAGPGVPRKNDCEVPRTLCHDR